MNPTPTGNLSGSSTPDDFDRFVDRFECAWRGGMAPDLGEFLPPNGHTRRGLLEELVKIDLEYRWRTTLPGGAGELPARPLVEDYVRVFPELAPAGRPPAALLQEEYRVRQRWGDRPDAAEYAHRFPHLAGLEATLRGVDADLVAEGRRRAAPPAGGRYERRHLHAAGGLGEVWLTHDKLVGRDVALKELRGELAHHPSLRHRFMQEARLTGRLEHPGIVPLYELAEPADESGPFYVMRFLRGRTLGETIKEHHTAGPAPRNLHPLLGAFVSVCNAVAYAHSRGVIHRDLKPANILVGDFGEVIVLDWGLAKVRGDSDDPLTADVAASPGLTRQGQVLGTPGYMAPEQAAGDQHRIDDRTDVFGLGAILYEILTGRPPFTGRDTDEILAQAKEGLVIPPRRVGRDVPAALDAVCRKALSRDPAARYASAAELAADVQRWLADEPVSAYRDPLSARLFRWGRRHRTLVAALAVLLLSSVVGLSAGTVLLAREQARTEEARGRAEANFRRALAVVDRFCTRVSEETLLDEPGMQPLRKHLLGDALEFYREIVTDPSATQGVRAELGRAHWRLGDLTEALEPGPVSREHYNVALEQFRGLAEAEPAVAQHAADAVGVQISLGNWHLRRREFDDAGGLYRAARQRQRQLVEEHPDEPGLRRALARVQNNLGLLYRDTDRLGVAAEELRTAAGQFAELNHRNPADAQARTGEAWARINLAAVLRAKRERGAEAEYRRVINLLDERADAPPGERAALAAAYNGVGELHRASLFQLKPAEEAYRKAFGLFDALAKENPAVTSYRRDRARCLFNLAGILARTSRVDEAEAGYRDALATFEHFARTYPALPEYSLDLGKNCLNLASVAALTGKHDRAAGYCDRANDVLEFLVRDGRTPEAATLLRSLLLQRARALGNLGRNADAVRDWDRITELDGGSTPQSQRLERVAMMTRAGQLRRAGEAAEQLAKQPWGGAQLYDLAAVLALASGAARKEAPLEADRRADLSVELLEKAKSAGYFRDAANVSHLNTDPDFNAIRQHAGFVRLMKTLGR